jgi:hypothetical protein
VEEKEPFLSRWSRRKLEARESAPAELPPVEPAESIAPAPPAPASEHAAAEPTPTGGKEYRTFFDPRVDEALRRDALKQLFSDPQFNVMDGLDTYIDDYSRPDPIPEAMLRRLRQAKELSLFEEDKNPGADASDAAVAADPGAAPPARLAADASAGAGPDAGTGAGVEVQAEDKRKA